MLAPPLDNGLLQLTPEHVGASWVSAQTSSGPAETNQLAVRHLAQTFAQLFGFVDSVDELFARSAALSRSTPDLLTGWSLITHPTHSKRPRKQQAGPRYYEPLAVSQVTMHLAKSSKNRMSPPSRARSQPGGCQAGAQTAGGNFRIRLGLPARVLEYGTVILSDLRTRPGVFWSKQGQEAAAEFQRMIAIRGISYPLFSLAHLQLGRAYALAGEAAKARAGYQDFLSLWKEADPDIPILKQAKAEYAKLQ